jgi:hypothetical protein
LFAESHAHSAVIRSRGDSLSSRAGGVDFLFMSSPFVGKGIYESGAGAGDGIDARTVAMHVHGQRNAAV